MSLDAYADLIDYLYSSLGVPAHVFKGEVGVEADDTLQGFLLAAAREPWGQWYGTTRPIFADYLEERGDVRHRQLRSVRLGRMDWGNGCAPRWWYFWTLDGDKMMGVRREECDARAALRRDVLRLFNEVRMACPACAGRRSLPYADKPGGRPCPGCSATGVLVPGNLLIITADES